MKLIAKMKEAADSVEVK